MNLSSQLSLATILEAKQGDVNHGTINTDMFAAWDVLDEAVSTITNVCKSGGALDPPPTISAVVALCIVVVAAQLLHEHRALWRLSRAGAAGGDLAQANAAMFHGVEPDPCVELGVVVGLASEGQHPVPKHPALTIAGVEGIRTLGPVDMKMVRPSGCSALHTMVSTLCTNGGAAMLRHHHASLGSQRSSMPVGSKICQ